MMEVDEPVGITITRWQLGLLIAAVRDRLASVDDSIRIGELTEDEGSRQWLAHAELLQYLIREVKKYGDPPII